MALGDLSDYVALPSNLKALESVKDFTESLAPFVVIYGPTGWGKSQLLDHACAQIGVIHHITCVKQETKAYLGLSQKQISSKWLVLDHAQLAMSANSDKQALRQILEQRVKLSKPTLLAVTQSQSAENLKALFVCREWKFVEIKAAETIEKEVLAREKAEKLNVTVHDNIIRMMAKISNFNGRSLIGAIHRLNITKSDWSEPEDLLLALGVLQPQLIESQFGDLRDRINEALAGPANTIKPEVTTKELMFVFNRVCGLSEHSTASYFSTEPGIVYKSVKSVEQKVKQDPARMNNLKSQLVKFFAQS